MRIGALAVAGALWAGSAAAQTPLITGYTNNGLRNNFAGFVGMEFTVGAAVLNETALGRVYVSGNSGRIR